MLAAQIARQRIFVARHGQQVQVQGHELRQRCIDRLNAVDYCADVRTVFAERAELQRLAEHVNERLVRRSASIGMASSAELADVCPNDSRTQLMQEAALADTRLADDQGDLPLAIAGMGE